jgi:hypothetical protein
VSAAAHSTYLVQQLDVVVVLTRLEQLYQPAHAFDRTNPDVICRGAVREGTTASTCERGLANGAKADGRCELLPGNGPRLCSGSSRL